MAQIFQKIIQNFLFLRFILFSGNLKKEEEALSGLVLRESSLDRGFFLLNFCFLAIFFFLNFYYLNISSSKKLPSLSTNSFVSSCPRFLQCFSIFFSVILNRQERILVKEEIISF